MLTIANLLLLVIYVSAWITPIQQNQKTIIQRLTLRKDPVEVSFKLKGLPLKARQTVRPEQGIRTEEFEGDADWLKDLTLKLRNTSGKTITYLEVNLYFPEVTENGRTGVHQIFLGVDPEGKFPRPELRLAPNELTEVPLAERYENIKRLLQIPRTKIPIETVSKIWVEFHSALFDDGTLFQAGTWYRRNPDQNAPIKWIKIDNQ